MKKKLLQKQKLRGDVHSATTLLFVFALTFSFSMTKLHAQTVTYSQNFTQSSASTSQCAAWGVFQGQLTPGSYHTMRIWGTNDMTGITLTDFTAVNAMATAIKNASTYISGTLNGHVWSVCNRYSGEVWVDPPSSCSGSNCPNPGYILRPCIGGSNSNWGGVNTATCGAPSQLMAIEFIAGPPCPVPTNLTITAVYSTAVFFNWTAPTGSNGAEFVIDQNATGPTGTPPAIHTTLTAESQSGLTPSTTYYLHLRNKCDSPSKSQWITTTFTTLPPCVIPPGISIPQVDTNSATITWQTITPAQQYEYIVKDVNSIPTNSTGVQSTTSNQVNFNALESGKTYYFFVRAKCLGGDSSAWVVDSFYVPLPCRAPEVAFNDLNSERVVASWNKPPTSYEYDIINSTTQLTPPMSGINVTNNSYLFPYLDDNSTYYVYARSYCVDHGINSISPWSQTSYKTWATGVEDVEQKANGLNISPNPVRDVMTIKLGSNNTDGVISILDVTGKVLFVQSVTSAEVNLDVNKLPSGSYIVLYHNQSGKIQKKFNKL